MGHRGAQVGCWVSLTRENIDEGIPSLLAGVTSHDNRGDIVKR